MPWLPVAWCRGDYITRQFRWLALVGPSGIRAIETQTASGLQFAGGGDPGVACRVCTERLDLPRPGVRRASLGTLSRYRRRHVQYIGRNVQFIGCTKASGHIGAAAPRERQLRRQRLDGRQTGTLGVPGGAAPRQPRQRAKIVPSILLTNSGMWSVR